MVEAAAELSMGEALHGAEDSDGTVGPEFGLMQRLATLIARMLSPLGHRQRQPNSRSASRLCCGLRHFLYAASVILSGSFLFIYFCAVVPENGQCFSV